MTVNVPPRLAGDPGRILDYAARFGETAAALRRAATELRALADDGVAVSIVIDVVRERAGLTAIEAANVATRYEGAAAAYRTFASRLEEAQAKAEEARAAIDAIDGPANQWGFRERSLEQAELFQLGPKSDELLEAQARVAAYERDYTRAMARYHEAEEDVRDAARAAEQALHGAALAARLDDSLIQRIAATGQQGYELLQRYLGNYITFARAGLELVRAGLDLLAIGFGALGFVFPVLLPVAFTLKAVSAVLSVQIASASLALVALGREGVGVAIKDAVRAARDVAERISLIQKAARMGPLAPVVLLESAADDVLPSSPQDVAGDLALSTLDIGLEYGLDVRYDAYPSFAGPAWGDRDTIVVDENWSWRLDGLKSGEAATELQEDISFDALKLLPLGGIAGAVNELDEEWREFQATVSGSGS
ncbi:hypothetical protein [Pseudolysinimonas sp.]|jgi:VIT1/CCC1 family predicted Fe2+/Mn2+ transporter|uniref:hypothetical protein n=1 Tax=Pseudolysinimonas sp. TaxID=2680009 RepID=UPI003782DE12